MALSTQRVSSSLPSAQSAPQWKHDVFLSFRGGDTRESFISHLYHELQYVRGIKTFKDDLELEEGKCISPSLLKAIEESRFAVVVLSPNYASSSWCLDELAKILESMEARETILPVFYRVDPSDVRYQKGSFAEAFTKHEEKSRQSAAKVKQWRVALTKVANLSGWDSKHYKNDRELIEGIVDFVWGQVHCKFRLLDPSREKLVGIDFRLKQLEILLAPMENDVRFIGIWGMGGIGKTTLAKLIFDRFSHIFKVSSFLADVRSYSSTNDLVHLQKQLLSNVAKKQNPEVWNVMYGSNMLKNCLRNKQVLLILDNVDHIKQLDILAGNKDWFGMGSRIIITTRDQRLLVEHDIEILYKVEGLNVTEALQLFSQNAFSKDQSEKEGGFMELSKCFVNYAKGLPLALKILGRSLYERGRDEWISALDMLMKSPDTEIFSALKISYDGLCEMNKSVFLDVAFFHKGKEKERVIEILDSCGLPGHIGINILIEKSLLTIEKTQISRNGVEMHDLIQEMAWEIVRRESYEEPGLRSRLCHRDDIFHVFMKNTGTEAITGVRLWLTESEEADSDWNFDAFSKMHRLRYIEFHNLIISSGPKVLPDTLRVIKWSSYPSKFLPPSFKPDALTELSLHRSKLVQLWNQGKYLSKLKYMDLSGSENLTSTPDFASTPNLEKLILEGCRNLVEIHPSFGVLKRLKVLQLMNCKSLKSLPREVAMDSLEYFSLFGCSKVKRIPEFAGQMKNLSELLLNGTGIEKLPASIERLVGLHLLSLIDCKSLVCLPSAICSLKSLKSLSLMGCSKLDRLPKNLGEMEGLERLELEETTITELPPSLSIMKNLRKLSFRGSLKLWHWSDLLRLFQRKSPNPMSLRLASLNDLCSLEELDLSDRNLCEGDIPNDIGCLSSLEFLDLSGNNFESLPPTIKLLSKLKNFKLERCKRLQQLPDLPSSRSLMVDTSNCDSLKVLSDPSTPTGFTNLYEFSFLSVNCFRLVDDEGRNNAIFSLLRRLAAQGLSPDFYQFYIVSPGSKIPEWFSNQIVGDSLMVELPLDSFSRWKGIAFCVVFADQEINTEALDQFSCYFRITCLSEGSYCANWVTGVGEVVRDHLWLFYMPSERFRDTTSTSRRFSFETCRGSTHGDLSEYTTTWMNVKMCGARLVYEQDLEQLTKGTLNNLKRAREYYDHDAAATGSGSGCFDKESLCKRHKEEI